MDDVIKILMDKGACYKAEDGAIMYRSAQYASKYGVVNRKKDENADGEEEAKDEVWYAPTAFPPILPPTSLPLQQAGRARF